jgi:hypothetical protein
MLHRFCPFLASLDQSLKGGWCAPPTVAQRRPEGCSRGRGAERGAGSPGDGLLLDVSQPRYVG